MTVLKFMEWLGESAAANAMNGPEWAFPVVESLHFIGFAFLIGTIAIVDLRLLGLAMRHLAAGRIVYAVGTDAEAARLAGIRPQLVTFLVFVFIGALTGLGGGIDIRV